MIAKLKTPDFCTIYSRQFIFSTAMGAYLPMAFLAGLLNLPVFVSSNLAVLQAGPWSAGAGAVAVADVCECVCRRHNSASRMSFSPSTFKY